MKDEESELKKTRVSVNIAALVAASSNPTQSIDPDKMKARILEKQEAVQDRKEKRKEEKGEGGIKDSGKDRKEKSKL